MGDGLSFTQKVKMFDGMILIYTCFHTTSTHRFHRYIFEKYSRFIKNEVTLEKI